MGPLFFQGDVLNTLYFQWVAADCVEKRELHTALTSIGAASTLRAPGDLLLLLYMLLFAIFSK